MWNRIVALSRRGVSVHLVSWDAEGITEEQLEVLRAHVASVRILQRNRAPYLALHPKYPTGAVSRIPSKGEFEAEVRRIKRISPDVVMLDGLTPAWFAVSLAQELGAPLVYRAHNVEYEYLLKLAAAEGNLFKKLKFLANAPRAKRFEKRVRDFSSLIYHISSEDREAWRNHRSAPKVKILPPYLHPDYSSTLVADYDRCNDIDVLYVGNLHTPNNVFGLKWFAKKVVPLLEELRIVVAGSKPTPEIYDVFKQSNVQIVANPEEVWSFYGRTRTIVNPVWHGSGVNIKMIEALAAGKPVVATSRGAQGLSKRLLAHVNVADDPGYFARTVLRRRADGFSARQRNDVIEEHGWENVTALIQDLGELASSKMRGSPGE